MKNLRLPFRAIQLCFALAASLAIAAPSEGASIVTFSEAQLVGLGFNGFTNPFLLTADGQFRVEAFWLNASGHFHIGSTGEFAGDLAESIQVAPRV